MKKEQKKEVLLKASDFCLDLEMTLFISPYLNILIK